ncbi:hypothetical protein Y1Q_0012600 [Alligator mississippiensis]|uniref:Uncharacterized protein n=1 Tax=Alligator mississippiensis TaxID=8496 RepID=A0A151M880_ALLMI|nr:hypothetical protein Y1Q_0012600 [Alligator mississippiensis]
MNQIIFYLWIVDFNALDVLKEQLQTFREVSKVELKRQGWKLRSTSGFQLVHPTKNQEKHTQINNIYLFLIKARSTIGEGDVSLCSFEECCSKSKGHME